MVKIHLEHVTKLFGKVVAVDDVTLTISEKEFMVLLGPSGCGKTTTLRIIAGLEEPTEGEVYIDDQPVTYLPPKDRDIAMVFQNYALYPHMKVYDNIAFPLRLRKYSKEEIEKNVKEVAEMLRIENLLDRMPKQLSGGEQQRVALARALIRRPKAFLLDEPLSNLDAKLRVMMRAELKRLQKELGVTTVYVTHDQAEAMTMADRIAIMKDGKIQQVGSPADVFNKPVNLFVAGFIGSPPMNFMECTTIEKDGQFLLDAGEFQLDVTDFKDIIKKNATSSELVLGIRPDNVIVSKERKEGLVTKATVYVVEPLGSETIIDLAIGDNIIKARTLEAVDLKMGDEVWVGFDMERLHIFDKKTEKAII